MKIEIRNTKTINQFNEEFNSFFPFLKVEFFKDYHPVGKASPVSKLIVNSTKLGTIQTKQKEGFVCFTNETTVSTFEQFLWEEFGLVAQVFRKSGNVWIETSLTDKWTLEKQNEEGVEMSKPHDGEKFNPDFDATDGDIYG